MGKIDSKENGTKGKIAAWALSPEQVAAELGTDVTSGLTSAQVAQLKAKYGSNELAKAPGKPLWKLVLEQFDDMLVKVCCVVITAFHTVAG
jgi:Ca2+-transporting ATPase